MAENEKKLIIDDDWKKQAQAEKEKLAQEEKKEKEETKEYHIPDATFNSLVNMLATQALFAMGIIAPKDMQDKVTRDLNLAKYNIDLLGVLEEKTKGNLNDEEQKMLEETLSQLRMAFVQISSLEENK